MAVSDFLKVMVPGPLSLKATSILERDWSNQELEKPWSTHFEGMSGGELRRPEPIDLWAGLAYRAARLKRAYEEARDRKSMNAPD